MNKIKLQKYCKNKLNYFCSCGYGCCPKLKRPDIAADRDTKVILDRFNSLQKGAKLSPIIISQPEVNKTVSFVEKY